MLKALCLWPESSMLRRNKMKKSIAVVAIIAALSPCFAFAASGGAAQGKAQLTVLFPENESLALGGDRMGPFRLFDKAYDVRAKAEKLGYVVKAIQAGPEQGPGLTTIALKIYMGSDTPSVIVGLKMDYFNSEERVVSFKTSDPRAKLFTTAGNVGIGSTFADFRAIFPKLELQADPAGGFFFAMNAQKSSLKFRFSGDSPAEGKAKVDVIELEGKLE